MEVMKTSLNENDRKKFRNFTLFFKIWCIIIYLSSERGPLFLAIVYIYLGNTTVVKDFQIDLRNWADRMVVWSESERAAAEVQKFADRISPPPLIFNEIHKTFIVVGLC